MKELQIVSQRVTSRDKLSNIEIPALEIQIQKAESELSEAASAADEVGAYDHNFLDSAERFSPLRQRSASTPRGKRAMSFSP